MADLMHGLTSKSEHSAGVVYQFHEILFKAEFRHAYFQQD